MQDRVVIFDSMVGFTGTAYRTASFKFTPDYPCCYGNEIWDKIGYNSACIIDISEMFASNRGFRGRAIEWRHTNSTMTNPRCPRCHGNEIWDKIGYNSACTRDISERLSSIWWLSRSGCRMMSIKF